MFVIKKSVYFSDINKMLLKFLWIYKHSITLPHSTTHHQSNSKIKNKMEGITFPNLKRYHKAIVSKT